MCALANLCGLASLKVGTPTALHRYRYGDSAPVAVIELVDRDVDAKGLDSGPVAEKTAEPEAAVPA